MRGRRGPLAKGGSGGGTAHQLREERPERPAGGGRSEGKGHSYGIEWSHTTARAASEAHDVDASLATQDEGDKQTKHLIFSYCTEAETDTYNAGVILYSKKVSIDWFIPSLNFLGLSP